MVSSGPGRKGHRWRRAQAECMRRGEVNGTPCYRCGKPIDYQLTRLYPQHSMAGTAHHIVGLEQGGHPRDQANLAPAHRGCNSAMSNQLRGRVARMRRTVRTPQQLIVGIGTL